MCGGGARVKNIVQFLGENIIFSALFDSLLLIIGGSVMSHSNFQTLLVTALATQAPRE